MTAPWDELEKLAKAAKECWNDGAWVQAGSLSDVRHLDEEDREFIAAANPAAILSLIAAARSTGDNLPCGDRVSVPREPTEAMHYDGDRALVNAMHHGGSITETTLKIWEAMLSAAPTSETGEGT